MKKSIISAVSLLLIGAVAICFLAYPRIYFGNRIKGDVTITYNGEPYELTSEQLKSHTKVREIENGRYRIELKGGEYGSNPFEIIFSPEMIVKVDFIHANWWYVTKFNLDINIDTEKGEIAYKGNYTSSQDSGTIDEKQTIGKEKLEVRFSTI